MKRFILLIALMIALLAVSAKAQSAFTENTVIKGSKYWAVFCSGTIYGTESLTSTTFKPDDFETITALQKQMVAVGDSTSIKIVRQGKYWGSSWSDAKTLVAADTIVTINALADTINYNPAEVRFTFTGTAANDTTSFYFKYILTKQ